MTRIHTELIPEIGSRLIGLGIAVLFNGTHGVRRAAESFIWGEPHRCHSHGCQCNGTQVQHHYRYHCQPRCYDCSR